MGQTQEKRKTDDIKTWRTANVMNKEKEIQCTGIDFRKEYKYFTEK